MAATLPLEGIVLETDAAPQPFKAKRSMWTEPRHVRDVAAKLAELHETTPEQIEQTTTANLFAMLGERGAVVERCLGLTPTPAVTANGGPTHPSLREADPVPQLSTIHYSLTTIEQLFPEAAAYDLDLLVGRVERVEQQALLGLDRPGVDRRVALRKRLDDLVG